MTNWQKIEDAIKARLTKKISARDFNKIKQQFEEDQRIWIPPQTAQRFARHSLELAQNEIFDEASLRRLHKKELIALFAYIPYVYWPTQETHNWKGLRKTDIIRSITQAAMSGETAFYPALAEAWNLRCIGQVQMQEWTPEQAAAYQRMKFEKLEARLIAERKAKLNKLTANEQRLADLEDARIEKEKGKQLEVRADLHTTEETIRRLFNLKEG